MLIGELAGRVGVSRDTVRFYEREGWMPRPVRRGNEYREYQETDVEHLRLLTELRRLGIPLADAARLAGWCHTGHCVEMTRGLPEAIAARRAEVAARIRDLESLDGHLARLAGHLEPPHRSLRVLAEPVSCCASASVVTLDGNGCACCSRPNGPPAA